ncbi:hypothetical protein TNCT_665181 [Trichonephila clavata]|uniref:Uncharacterized protein n=1 Tax=Trichonephila clavata TaxID=2740835 RepID=A0A8X6LSB6_TRICU|nr:hypothetical protein TNCT_665181 [Trichonephila clavata]
MYAQFTEDQARNQVVQGDTTTKFLALRDGFIDYLKSVDTFTVEKAQSLCILFQSQWLIVASQTGASNDLYMKCVTDGDGDSDESGSESDYSDDSGSDYSISGSSSSSSESDSSSSESDSSSSESDSSSSESDSSSSESDSSSSESDSSSSGSDSNSSE